MVGEDLDFTDLLADDPRRPCRELHSSDGGDLVGLDVRAVRDAVAVEVGLHAADVLGHDVEVDGDDGSVEVGHGGHGAASFSSSRLRAPPY